MSKIGSKPIVIPEGVTATINKDHLVVKGKLGTLNVQLLSFVKAEIVDGKIVLTSGGETKQARANWGTLGANIKNAVEGVTKGFTKKLEIQGVGFKAAMEGKNVTLNLGFSHPIKYQTPEGITISVEKAFITIAGFDKYLVGQVAAEIRDFKKPEPYLGKGIRYFGEHVRRKDGKKVAGSGTAA